MTDKDQSGKIGFGSPPSQHRFTKGQSGNPKGRPKGSRNLKTDLSALLKGNIEITINGKTRRMTRQEAMLLSLFHRAVSKDSGAAKTLLDLVIKLQHPDDDAAAETTISASDQIIVENYLRRNGYLPSGGTDD